MDNLIPFRSRVPERIPGQDIPADVLAFKARLDALMDRLEPAVETDWRLELHASDGLSLTVRHRCLRPPPEWRMALLPERGSFASGPDDFPDLNAPPRYRTYRLTGYRAGTAVYREIEA